jgi:hypothetical protein
LCDGNAGRLKDWYNLTAGLEFKSSVETASIDVFEAKCTPNEEAGFVPPPQKIIPPWASRLLMLVDTQKDKYYWLIRAFGPGFRSQRIDHGEAPNLEVIEQICDGAYYHYEADQFPPQRCFMLAIDTGGGLDDENADATRTDQLYQWCAKSPLRRIPLKGMSKPFDDHIRWREVIRIDPRQKRDPYRVILWQLDPLYWQDLLSGYITQTNPVIDQTTGEVTDKTVDHWMLNDRNDRDVYNRHMTNVTRARLRKGRGHRYAYIPRTVGARHDFRDLEGYVLAIAHGPGQCHALPSMEQRIQQLQAERAAATSKPKGMTDPYGRPFLANQR